jgi:FkbM family methyltransferase
MLRALRTVARGLGVERQALAVRRRLLSARVRADIRDHELLLALLARSLAPDSDCLDVGAHEGSVLREMVRLAPQGRHVAWEPLPELAQRLRSEFPAVEVREAALSDRAAERSFARVVGDPGWSGFVERPTPAGGVVETITVRSERLDDALADGVQPAFVKIDVEGAEEQVLRGALETLRRHRPLIVFEHGLGSADYYGTTPERIHDLLAGELGYGIRSLDGEGPYTRAEFAAIFARGERVNFVAHPNR